MTKFIFPTFFITLYQGPTHNLAILFVILLNALSIWQSNCIC